MKKITFTQQEFDRAVHEAVMKERHILFDLCLEDYGTLPEYAEIRHKRKSYVVIPKAEWEKHKEQVGSDLGDLMTARELIGHMYPVYHEYYGEYQKAHSVDLDTYISFINTEYDAEDFERVRERFESEIEWLQDVDEPER